MPLSMLSAPNFRPLPVVHAFEPMRYTADSTIPEYPIPLLLPASDGFVEAVNKLSTPLFGYHNTFPMLFRCICQPSEKIAR